MNTDNYFDEIDMSLIIKNIRTIAKEKNYKIGELEKDAGLSVGYIARLENKDNNTKPSIEVIYNLSKLLKENIDLIINYDYEYIDKEGKFLYDFFEKLVSLTAKHSIHWEFQDDEYITNTVERINPIYTYESSGYERYCYFKSHFTGSIDAIKIDMVITKIKEIEYYLVNYIDENKNQNYFEFYSFKNKELNKIYYTSEYSNIPLYDKMEELYDLARKTAQYVYLNENTKNDLNDIFDL